MFDQPARQIPYLGNQITSQPINLGSDAAPSLERLTLLKPDLILGEHGIGSNYPVFSEIAPTLLWGDRTSKGAWQDHLRGIAQALHLEERATQVRQENAIAQSLTASQENRVYFATFYKWNGLNGPIGTELILEQLRQFLLPE
ncbi:MAG: ABC transporter substrate-binding protein [Cyanothece sp. SIO1E1]|nr:ABC transporter substrate-binding protein [Cyanothece sp. SIO1E1]